MGFKMRLVVAGLLILTCFGAAYPQSDSAITTYLRKQSQPPVDYVLSKASSHRITIIGEGHWLQQDVNLVTALIPLLNKADIDLATELLPAAEQARIDELITAAKWNPQAANAVMRTASWPYQEYRDLLSGPGHSNRSGLSQSYRSTNMLPTHPAWSKWPTAILLIMKQTSALRGCRKYGCRKRQLIGISCQSESGSILLAGNPAASELLGTPCMRVVTSR